MKNNIWGVLNLVWTLGYTIAIPVAVLAFAGAWADKKFGTSPILLLAGIFLSMAVSGIAVYRQVKNLTKD